MSVFAIERLCHDIRRDKALRKSIQDNPEAALSKSPYPLTPQERATLLAGDVGTLYRMGVNAFLLGNLARNELFGLDATRYGERMRAVDESVRSPA